MVALENTISLDDDIVISGISGSFPGADNVEDFQTNLFNKVNSVKKVSDPQWSKESFGSFVPNKLGKISGEDRFDNSFFGIHSKQCTSLDPATRMIMEKSFEAVVDAGLNPADLRGTNTTTFTGSVINESENIWFHFPTLGGFGIVGHSRCMMANRIAYFIGTHGASFALISDDTCGLQVLTQAYDCIKDGYADAAVVAAASLIFQPEMSRNMQMLKRLSKDGHSRPFSIDADGQGRGEGIIVLILQKAKDAKRAYCSIVKSGQSYFGDKWTTMTRVSGDPLISFLENFYQECGIDPTKVAYVEADGSGYVPLEKVEVEAMEKLMKGRKMPLLIGSVKGNTGHTEGAASFVSLIKLIITMNSRKIPPTINHGTPNPEILPIMRGSVKVVTEITPYNDELLAMNSFGMGGGFGHLLVKPYTKLKVPCKDNLPRLVLVSSRTGEGIQKMLKKLYSMPFDAECVRLIQDVHSKPFQHNFRGFTILNNDEKKVEEFQNFDGSKRPIWFVFSGMGSQWTGMGKHLMNLPICAAAIHTCHNVLKPKGLDLISIITEDDPKIFDNILYSFVGIAAIQIALVDVLNALGIVPDGLIGHSVGELGVAYADGTFTPEQTILGAYCRGKVSLEKELIRGSMAAIGLGADNLRSMLPADIDIACHNSSESCTISGPAEEVKKFVAVLQGKNIFAKAVNVSNIAYHSRYISTLGPTLLEYLREVIPNPKPRSAKWFSTSVPEKDWDSPLARTSSAEYHNNNMQSAVLFEEASRHIPKNAIAIEIAPHGLLQAILKRSLGKDCTNIPMAQRGHKDCIEFLFSSIGKMYMAGMVPVISELFPPVQFPVSRGTPYISPFVTWDHQESWYMETQGKMVHIAGDGNVIVSTHQKEDEAYLGHQVNGHVLMPTFGMLKIVWQCIAKMATKVYNKTPVVLENVRIHSQLELIDTSVTDLYYSIQTGMGHFEVVDGMKTIASGIIRAIDNTATEFLRDLSVPTENCFQLTREEVYNNLRYRGLDYSGEFQGILGAKLNDKGFVAKIRWTGNWVTFVDAILQLVILQCTEDSQILQLPLAFQKIIIDPLAHEDLPVPTEIEAVFDRSLGIVKCGGLEIRGIQTYKPILPAATEDRYKMETIKFLPHSNPGLQDLGAFVNMCIQLAVENNINTIIDNNNTVNIVELTNIKSSSSLMPYIHSSVSNFSELQASVKTIACDDNTIFDGGNLMDVLFAVSNLNTFQQGIALLDNNDGFLLVRLTENQTLPTNHTLAIVAQQKFGMEHFILVRKSVMVGESIEEVVRLSGNYTTWIRQLRDILFNRPTKNNRKLFVVIGCHQQQKGVHHFIREVAHEKIMKNIRCVFVLDKQVPRFSLTQSTYSEQMRADLKYNVYMDGAWGSFRKLSLEDSIQKVDQEAFLPSLRFIGLKSNYLGVNLKDMSIIENGRKLTPCDIGHLDFAGVTPYGERVMGVAKVNGDVHELTLEPHLTWQVPKSWTFEEAATVPLAYATAYYALVLTAQTLSTETVLVQAGCTSIGLAAISVATNLGCNVYTTVANTAQRIFLKKQYPQLNDSHILSYDDLNFDIHLRMATGYVGAQVILNCLPGAKFQASLRCLAAHGRFIQLGRDDLCKNHEIGLLVFLKSTSFYGVASDNLFNASTDWKNRLHAAVEEGIKTGTVQPLEKKIFSRDSMDDALLTLVGSDNIGKVILTVPSEQKDERGRCQFDSTSSYIIAGQELENCLNLADWMIVRGASKLVVAHGEKTMSDYVNRRLKLISQLYHKVDITTVPLGGVITAEVAASLVQQAFNMAPLVGIFILPLSDDVNMSLLSLRHLDQESRNVPTVTQFVSILCDSAWSITEKRCNAGLSGLAIQSLENIDLRKSLTLLDQILLSRDNSVVFISKQVYVEDNTEGEVEKLGPMLPSTIDDLVDLGMESEMDGCTLVEIQTKTARNADLIEILPIFVIPGLQGPPSRVLEPLARNLMYPVFYAKLPHVYASLQDTAAHIAKQMQEIQGTGPYNLVGVSWGGALAIETARQLETHREVTNVILLDGAPEALQGMARLLGVGDEMHVNLLAKLLDITCPKELDVLLSLSDWESQVTRALVLSNHEPNTSKKLSSALCMIRANLQALLAYKPSPERLAGSIILLKPDTTDPHDTYGLNKLFSCNVTIRLVPGDHRTILRSKEAVTIINDEVLAPL